MLPALLFTIFVTQIPFLFTLFYSLTDWRLDRPEPRKFVGFENYADLPDDPFFRDAAWVSIKMTVLAVLLSLVVGTVLALLLDRKFFGQGFVRTLLITPFLVMPVVAGFLWKTQMFNATFGVLNWLLGQVGVEPIEFATEYPLWSVIVVLVWQWSPFMMLIVLAGLQGQDASVLEAARVDGATSWGIFRQITLPQLRPYLELGTLLGAIYLVQVYDHIEIVTGGSPDSKNRPSTSPSVRSVAATSSASPRRTRSSSSSPRSSSPTSAYGCCPTCWRASDMTSVVQRAVGGIRRSNAEPVLGQNRTVAHLLSLLTWLIGMIFFFPLFWMVLNGFKEELDANASPKLFFDPTLDRFTEVTEETSGLLSFSEAFSNSLWIVAISTVLVILLAVPAAYALAIRPMKKWRDVLFFFISTKFLPIVGAIMPLWIIARDLDLLNTRTVLIILYTAMNLPLAVWMLRSFFAEVPRELIEAAQMDGCSLMGQIRQVILPIVAPGLAATALLCVIFAWNEFFLAVQLNPVEGSTLPVWVASQESGRGNFLAKLSAASVLATLPVVIAGWIAQKRMIRGLAMGAIK
ncbi:MAG: ABC transporter permease subunit [Acidimicrobiales bacterium]